MAATAAVIVVLALCVTQAVAVRPAMLDSDWARTEMSRVARSLQV